jgi:hypothetical protein
VRHKARGEVPYLRSSRPARGGAIDRPPERIKGRFRSSKRPLTCGGRYWDRTSDLFGVNIMAVAPYVPKPVALQRF